MREHPDKREERVWKRTLIEEVSFKPLLWRVQDSNYMKRDSREQAWADITARLNLRFEMNLKTGEASGTYKSLKDYYLRQKRSTAKVTASGAGKNKSYRNMKIALVLWSKMKLLLTGGVLTGQEPWSAARISPKLMSLTRSCCVAST
ncbi:hypothetical protein L596_002681 [Steinernema carpocapsae]|uniref:MADF domain-containing protein n=1 Tax=Steinernema carpocapsae TaxID=34508 RepID=A0A4U8UQU6_STECR|nr:hypothetical protein L596_002681 [Steinernema carpocapsae]